MTRRSTPEVAAASRPIHTAKFTAVQRFRLWRFSFRGRVNNDALARAILEFRRRHPGGPRAALNGWQSPWQTHRQTRMFDRLIRLIERAATTALETERKKRTSRVCVTESWAAVYQRGDSAALHDHGLAHYSGVYYVRVTPDHPSLEFEDGYAVKPVPGTFLLFEGGYRHRVPRIRSSEARIVVAVNLLRVPKYLVASERRLR